MTARRGYDVVIIGGAVTGSAIAYFLMEDPGFDGSVLVVERDRSYRQASTALSCASIRHQFSNPINVQISQFGTEFFRSFGERMTVGGESPDLAFKEQGYLFLASDDAGAAVLRENHAVHAALGARTALLEPDDVKARFPHLNVDDLVLASLGLEGEGWIDNMALMQGFRRKARAEGAEYVEDEVVGIVVVGGRVTGVTLASGARIACGAVVNAAGPRAAAVAAMAGLSIPVEPRKRSVFVFDCADPPPATLPLMIDSSGVFCRPEGNLFITGISPNDDPAVSFDDFEVRHEEFEAILWPALAARSPNFQAIRVTSAWAGHYAFNRLDHNVIVGPPAELSNFYFANGFSGHGLQQSPAIGRGVAELIAYGAYRTLDLDPLGYRRIVAGEPFLEKAVI